MLVLSNPGIARPILNELDRFNPIPHPPLLGGNNPLPLTLLALSALVKKQDTSPKDFTLKKFCEIDLKYDEETYREVRRTVIDPLVNLRLKKIAFIHFKDRTPLFPNLDQVFIDTRSINEWAYHTSSAIHIKSLLQLGAASTGILFDAAKNGYVELVRLIFDANAEDPDYDSIHRALHSAAYGARTEVVRVLLDASESVNCRDYSTWMTPLHKALLTWHCASHRQAETVRLLIDRGADPTTLSGTWHSPLQLAWNTDNTEAIGLVWRAVMKKRVYQILKCTVFAATAMAALNVYREATACSDEAIEEPFYARFNPFYTPSAPQTFEACFTESISNNIHHLSEGVRQFHLDHLAFTLYIAILMLWRLDDLLYIFSP